MESITKIRVVLISLPDSGFENKKEWIATKLKPKLEKICRSSGREFEVIDMSGVNSIQHYMASSLYTRGLLQNEHNCCLIKLVFLGDQTGPDALLSTILSREFDQLLSTAKKLVDLPSVIIKLMKSIKTKNIDDDTKQESSSSELIMKFQRGLDSLEAYYVKDCNAVPAEHVLSIPKRQSVNVQEDIKTLRQIQTVLKVAASHSEDLTETRKNMYFMSELEDNIESFIDRKNTIVVTKLSKNATKESVDLLEDDESDDEEVDLFGDDDDEAMNKLKEQRIEAYNEKKAKKPKVIAKSSILLEVKPWDDETDMKEMEKHVRSIEMDGLKWCASKLVPVGYGIMKLQINCVVEDDKVSTDDLEEQITAKEDLVQSMDIVAFNKI